MTQGEASKPKGQKNKKLMLVRYGRMGVLGWFEHSETSLPLVRTRVVIKTKRGLELGDIVGQFNYKDGQFRASCRQVEDYFANRTKDYPLGEGGIFVRMATDEDIMEEKHLVASSLEEAKSCQKFINEMKLQMKVVEAEHLFGGERIIIYFTSNGRVDFRELVRKLAREYQTRIELRQIGARDEAKLISDFETCGQECCCRRFLKILEPVNMRMAKLQKATLDPSKISGHCGRLKCCLRYEDSTYRELKGNLPRRNSWVETPSGVGKVIDAQVLTQLVVVQMQVGGKREAFKVDEVTPTDAPPPRPVAAAKPPAGRARPPRRRTENDAQDNKGKQRNESPPQKQGDKKDAPAQDAPAGQQQTQKQDKDQQKPQDGSQKPPKNRRNRRRNKRRKPQNKPGENNAKPGDNNANKPPKSDGNNNGNNQPKKEN